MTFPGPARNMDVPRVFLPVNQRAPLRQARYLVKYNRTTFLLLLLVVSYTQFAVILGKLTIA